MADPEGRGAARVCILTSPGCSHPREQWERCLPAKCPGWWQGPAAHGAGGPAEPRPAAVPRLWPHCQQAHSLSPLCQWNRHGYDVAKIFGGKFTHVAPVWLQLRRHGREMFEVTGLDDVDQGSDAVACLCPPWGSGRVSMRERESEDEQACV